MSVVDICFLIGAVLSVAGFAISWKWNVQLSLACSAFGAAAFGTACFLRSLHLTDVLLGTFSYVLGIFFCVVAAILERRERKDGEQP